MRVLLYGSVGETCVLLSDPRMPPDEFAEIERQLHEALAELKECGDPQRRRTILASMRWLLVEADSLLLSEMGSTTTDPSDV